MRDVGVVFAYAFIVVGCVAIGAWLVVQGHPWFGFFAMLIGGSVSFKTSPLNEDE